MPTTWANIGDNTILNLSGLSPRKDRHKGLYMQSDYSVKADWGGMKHQLQGGVAHQFIRVFGGTEVFEISRAGVKTVWHFAQFVGNQCSIVGQAAGSTHSKIKTLSQQIDPAR